jgi:hypothetical protein
VEDEVEPGPVPLELGPVLVVVDEVPELVELVLPLSPVPTDPVPLEHPATSAPSTTPTTPTTTETRRRSFFTIHTSGFLRVARSGPARLIEVTWTGVRSGS